MSPEAGRDFCLLGRPWLELQLSGSLCWKPSIERHVWTIWVISTYPGLSDWAPQITAEHLQLTVSMEMQCQYRAWHLIDVQADLLSGGMNEQVRNSWARFHIPLAVSFPSGASEVHHFSDSALLRAIETFRLGVETSIVFVVSQYIMKALEQSFNFWKGNIS